MLKEVVKKIIKFLELVDRYCLLLLGEAQRVSHRFRGVLSVYGCGARALSAQWMLLNYFCIM